MTTKWGSPAELQEIQYYSQQEKAKAVCHDLPIIVLMQTRPCATLDPKEIVDAISAKQRLEDLMLLNVC